MVLTETQQYTTIVAKQDGATFKYFLYFLVYSNLIKSEKRRTKIVFTSINENDIFYKE